VTVLHAPAPAQYTSGNGSVQIKKEINVRAVVQRVSRSRVTVEAEEQGATGEGLVVLLGVDENDTEEDARYLVNKIAGLRIFNDPDGRFNLSLEDVGGSVLVISQFTLHGDCRKGRRPSFVRAARPEKAVPLYEFATGLFREKGIETATGEFGAHMMVELVNDGPVTLLVDSKKEF
jgi:D-aminoacyl-tRNA deacylase